MYRFDPQYGNALPKACFRDRHALRFMTNEDAWVQRETVESSVIASVGYDPRRRVLEIEFTSGSVYRYREVPEHLHAGLMTAASHGKFFDAYIRDEGFDYEQVR
jgi:hypothetical protein